MRRYELLRARSPASRVKGSKILSEKNHPYDMRPTHMTESLAIWCYPIFVILAVRETKVLSTDESLMTGRERCEDDWHFGRRSGIPLIVSGSSRSDSVKVNLKGMLRQTYEYQAESPR